MIHILPIALAGILATAATSTPFNHKRQEGQQVIFRSDLKQGEGQSPEFKNVFRKQISNADVQTPADRARSEPHENKHHRPIRHHVRGSGRESQRRQGHRRIARYPRRRRQLEFLHQHGHRSGESNRAAARHSGQIAAERRLVLYRGWRVEVGFQSSSVGFLDYLRRWSGLSEVVLGWGGGLVGAYPRALQCCEAVCRQFTVEILLCGVYMSEAPFFFLGSFRYIAQEYRDLSQEFGGHSFAWIRTLSIKPRCTDYFNLLGTRLVTRSRVSILLILAMS